VTWSAMRIPVDSIVRTARARAASLLAAIRMGALVKLLRSADSVEYASIALPKVRSGTEHSVDNAHCGEKLDGFGSRTEE